MQGTCFCPKQRSWYKARRGGHRVGIPRNFTCFQEGVSGTAQLSPACRLLTLFPVQFQVTATLESFPVLLQARDRTHRLEQGPAPGKRQSPVAQLFCSQCDPRPPNTAHLLRGAEMEKASGARYGMPGMLHTRPHLAWAGSPGTFIPALPGAGCSVHPRREATCSQVSRERGR